MTAEVGMCVEEAEEDEEASANNRDSNVRLAAKTINYAAASICLLMLIVASYQLWNLQPICDPIELPDFKKQYVPEAPEQVIVVDVDGPDDKLSGSIDNVRSLTTAERQVASIVDKRDSYFLEKKKKSLEPVKYCYSCGGNAR